MAEEQTSIKLRNGVKVFTRMADNARATALAVVDVMKKMRKTNHVIDEMVPMIDKVLASSSNNFIFSDSVFFESEESPNHSMANRVLELYIRWKKPAKVDHDFLISISGDIGGNSVNFAIGWDESHQVPSTAWTEYVYKAMNEVMIQVFDDMDALIDEEENQIRKMSYENIIRNELNKKIATAMEKNPERLEIEWSETTKTHIRSVDCEINKLSSDIVDVYPVRDFIVTCKDEDGTPIYKVATRVTDPKSKSPDANFDLFVSIFEGDAYSDYMKISKDRLAASLAIGDTMRGKTAFFDVILPAIERVIPDLATLQTAIINQTIDKIGKNVGND